MEFVSIQCTINKMSITCMSLRLRSATELSYLAERSISNHGHSSKWTITEQSPCFCPQLSEGSPQEIGKTRTFIPKCWIYITSDIKEPTGFPRKISISGHMLQLLVRPAGRVLSDRPLTTKTTIFSWTGVPKSRLPRTWHFWPLLGFWPLPLDRHFRVPVFWSNLLWL